MEVSISHQLYVFLAMTLCGACSGAVFDLFRIIRKQFGATTLTTSLSDILFWLIISTAMSLTLFYVSGGEIRWHEAIGVILGAVIYFLLFSKLFMGIIGWILRICTKLFLTILKIVLTPVVFLYKMIKKPLCWIFVSLKPVFRCGKHKTVGFFALIKNSFKKLKLVMKKS